MATRRRGIRDKITEAELRAAYENRKAEFQERPNYRRPFRRSARAAPPVIRPFADVRSELALALGEERAQAEIIDQFTKIKDDVLFRLSKSYAQAAEEIEETKKQGTKPKTELPISPDLKELASASGWGMK